MMTRKRTLVAATCLLIAAVVLGCGDTVPADYPAAPENYFVRPAWKPIDGDKPTMAKLGQEAMDTLGYDEIVKRAEKVGWVKTVRVAQFQSPAGKVFIGDGATAAAGGELLKLFTRYAVTAGVTSQADSPLPGPADAVAVGILVVGRVHLGALAMQEILDARATTTAAAVVTATAVPTATATTTTTSPPLASNRDRWQCTASCNVQQINQKVDCPARVTGSAGGLNEPAACIEAKRSATQSTPAGCYPRHC